MSNTLATGFQKPWIFHTCSDNESYPSALSLLSLMFATMPSRHGTMLLSFIWLLILFCILACLIYRSLSGQSNPVVLLQIMDSKVMTFPDSVWQFYWLRALHWKLICTHHRCLQLFFLWIYNLHTTIQSHYYVTWPTVSKNMFHRSHLKFDFLLDSLIF